MLWAFVGENGDWGGFSLCNCGSEWQICGTRDCGEWTVLLLAGPWPRARICDALAPNLQHQSLEREGGYAGGRKGTSRQPLACLRCQHPRLDQVSVRQQGAVGPEECVVPRTDRRREATLGSLQDPVGQHVPYRLAKPGFRREVVVRCVFAQADYRLDELIVQQWQPQLDAIGHAEAIGLGNTILEQVCL